jgi:hypothetical protein
MIGKQFFDLFPLAALKIHLSKTTPFNKYHAYVRRQPHHTQPHPVHVLIIIWGMGRTGINFLNLFPLAALKIHWNKCSSLFKVHALVGTSRQPHPTSPFSMFLY